MTIRVTQARLVMVTSALLRAARAYLDWTIDRAAAASGLNRRTIIRLENEERYAQAQPPSLATLVAAYRQQQLILSGNGLAMAVPDAVMLDRSRRSA
jgi:DNA-binding XRE family transcriptional regulator